MHKKFLPYVLSIFFLAGCKKESNKSPTIIDAYSIIKSGELIDLSHSFLPGIPHWHGFPDETRTVLYSHEEGMGTLGSGFLAHQYSIVGQWGTHIDPPVHFIKGLRTLDQITLDEMILPLIVINVKEAVEKNPDYELSLNDLKKWEQKNGDIPMGSFVAMYSGWSERWPDSIRMENKDSKGTSHYPGWSLEALKYLSEVKKVNAIGHEPTDTDCGIKTSVGNYECEAYFLGQNKYQIEMLTNLDRVPENGSILFVGFPKPLNGSGFPVRLIAIVPKN